MSKKKKNRNLKHVIKVEKVVEENVIKEMGEEQIDRKIDNVEEPKIENKVILPKYIGFGVDENNKLILKHVNGIDSLDEALLLINRLAEFARSLILDEKLKKVDVYLKAIVNHLDNGDK